VSNSIADASVTEVSCDWKEQEVVVEYNGVGVQSIDFDKIGMQRCTSKSYIRSL